MIPGSNVLAMALSALGTQTVSYSAFVSRETNAVGVDVATDAAPIQITGSFQPIPKALYQQLGLDLTKTYVDFYVSADALGVDRDVSGDQISYLGDIYTVESVTAWFAIDGWNALRLIRVDKDA